MRTLPHALMLPFLLAACAATVPAQSGSAAGPAGDTLVTLEEAMADPSWIARSPSRARWSPDGTRVLYSREEPDGTTLTWEVDLAGDGTPRALSVEEEAALAPTGGVWNPDRSLRLATDHGDLGA